jgi:hypothetical protein
MLAARQVLVNDEDRLTVATVGRVSPAGSGLSRKSRLAR